MTGLKVSPWQDGACFEIKVQPRSSRNQICGVQGSCLKVRLTAPPVDGEANQALTAFMADLLGVGKRSVEIIRGETSKLKLIGIHGISPEEVRQVISGAARDD